MNNGHLQSLHQTLLLSLIQILLLCSTKPHGRNKTRFISTLQAEINSEKIGFYGHFASRQNTLKIILILKIFNLPNITGHNGNSWTKKHCRVENCVVNVSPLDGG